jgi:hypothetical protein
MISPRSGGKVSGITRSDSHFGQINMARNSLSVQISSSVREGTPRHEQVSVKVKAWADRGVAPLVEALAEFPGLISLESCQGGEEDAPDAYVTFKRGGTWQELGAFLAWLSVALGDQPYFYRLSLEWNYGGSSPWARIYVAPRSVDNPAQTISQSAATPVSVPESAFPLTTKKNCSCACWFSLGQRPPG